MSGFTGKTEQLSGTPEDVRGLREWLAGMLSGRGEAGLFGGGEMSEEMLAPYRELFKQENERTFAQAKESAGNLTGSGYGNILGRSAEAASTQQGAFLANLMETRRRSEADRMAQLLTMMGSAGVSSPQHVYQPGFLDYLGQGIEKGATAYATRGN